MQKRFDIYSQASYGYHLRGGGFELFDSKIKLIGVECGRLFGDEMRGGAKYDIENKEQINYKSYIIYLDKNPTIYQNDNIPSYTDILYYIKYDETFYFFYFDYNINMNVSKNEFEKIIENIKTNSLEETIKMYESMEY